MNNRRVRHLNPAQCGAQIALDARYISGVADGAALATWAARANTTIGATASGSGQPIYRASSINGRPAVEFDGSDDFMNLDAGALSITNNVPSCSITSVLVKTGAGDAQQNVIAISVNGSTNPRAALIARSTNLDVIRAQGRRLDADSTVTASSAGDSTSACVATARHNYASDKMESGLNGVFAAASIYVSGAGNTSATNSNRARIGALDPVTFRFLGRISAIVVAAPMLTTSLANRIRQSLGFSYRIATA